MKKYQNIEITYQTELVNEFGRVVQCYRESGLDEYQCVAVSYFDHWLSNSESKELLQNILIDEKKKRYGYHRKFCELLISQTEILSFKSLGRKKENIKFRRFLSNNYLLEYLAPNALQNEFGDYSFLVLLPKLKMLYCGGFDSTNYFYSLSENNISFIEKLANESGLYVLPQS